MQREKPISHVLSQKLSKLDVGIRQLETAIHLYFQSDDLVSIHTLACAAHEIFQSLNSRAGGEATIRQQFRVDIKADRVKEFYARLDAARNFFKHADRDPDDSIEFSPFESEVVILDACLTHKRLTNSDLPTAVCGTFLMWSTLTWANAFVSYEGLDTSTPSAMRLAALSRADFFAEILPIARQASGEGA